MSPLDVVIASANKYWATQQCPLNGQREYLLSSPPSDVSIFDLFHYFYPQTTITPELGIAMGQQISTINLRGGHPAQCVPCNESRIACYMLRVHIYIVGNTTHRARIDWRCFWVQESHIADKMPADFTRNLSDWPNPISEPLRRSQNQTHGSRSGRAQNTASQILDSTSRVTKTNPKVYQRQTKHKIKVEPRSRVGTPCASGVIDISSDDDDENGSTRTALEEYNDKLLAYAASMADGLGKEH